MNHRQHIGTWGEAIARTVVAARGWEVVETNWRPEPGRGSPRGELDLICRTQHGYVVCEVKTRSSLDWGHPLESIGGDKARKLRLLAQTWLRSGDLPPGPIRVDAIAITGTSSRFVYEHLEGIA